MGIPSGRRQKNAACNFTVSSRGARLRVVVPKLFGLDMQDQLAPGWERHAHLAIGEVRDDGAIDMLMLLESGTLRYLATLDARDTTGIVEAPEAFEHITRFTREVLETNEPIVRRRSTTGMPYQLTVFPILGARKRVVYVLEPHPVGEESPS